MWRVWKLLGVPLYRVCYHFPSKTVPGRYVEGKSAPMFHSTAASIAAYGNANWSGVHWIERIA